MDGSLLGEGESGPANIHSNFRLAMESIRLACEAALRSAAIGEQSLQHSHAGLGLAGAGIKRLRPLAFTKNAICIDGARD